MQTTLTVEQALALAAILNGSTQQFTQAPQAATARTPFPAIICTEHRGVIFGYITDANADPMVVTDARMCLRWSKPVGGVFGLAEKGPFDASKSGETTVSATVKTLTVKDITAVFSCEASAEAAWLAAPVVGR